MRLLPLLLSAAFVAGCSSRPDPKEWVLRVESTKPGTEYTVNGSIDADGTKTEVKDQRTPYRFTSKTVVINARLISTDADCNLLAGIEGAGDPELVNSAIGPVGCQVKLDHVVMERTARMAIKVEPLPVPAGTAAPAATPAPAPAEAAPAAAAAATEAQPSATPAP